MWSTFCLVLSADLSLFQLLTVFLWFLVCMAFQPFNQLIFHHQLAPADPQGWEIRAAQKVVRARYGNLQRLRKLLCVHYIGMVSNGALLIQRSGFDGTVLMPFAHEVSLDGAVVGLVILYASVFPDSINCVQLRAKK